MVSVLQCPLICPCCLKEQLQCRSVRDSWAQKPFCWLGRSRTTAAHRKASAVSLSIFSRCSKPELAHILPLHFTSAVSGKLESRRADFDSFYHDFCPGWKQSSCLKHFQMRCMANGTGETSSSSTQWHQQFWIFTASAGGCKSDPANQQLYSQQTNTLPSLPKGSELLSLWPVLCTEIKYLHLWAPEVCLTTSRPRSNLGWIEIMGLLYVAKWDRGATAAFWHSSWIKGGFASNKQCGHRTCSLVLPQNRDICLRGVGREQFYHLLFTLVSNFSTCWVILRYVHTIVHLILHCSFKETQFLIQLGPKAPSSDPKGRGR